MTVVKTDRVIVLGLAKTGEETTAVLRREGVAVTIVEESPAGPEYTRRAGVARESGATVLEAAPSVGWEQFVSDFDLVVPSPGVRPDHPALVAARSRRVPIRSEIELAASRIDAPLVAVTGTNGKTTVTSLITAMLDASGRHAIAAGNIGTPLIRFAGAGPTTTVISPISSRFIRGSPGGSRETVSRIPSVSPSLVPPSRYTAPLAICLTWYMVRTDGACAEAMDTCQRKPIPSTSRRIINLRSRAGGNCSNWFRCRRSS